MHLNNQLQAESELAIVLHFKLYCYMALQMKNSTTNLYSVSKENMSEKHAQPDRSGICVIVNQNICIVSGNNWNTKEGKGADFDEKARLKMNMKQHQIVKKSSPYA